MTLLIAHATSRQVVESWISDRRLSVRSPQAEVLIITRVSGSDKGAILNCNYRVVVITLVESRTAKTKTWKKLYASEYVPYDQGWDDIAEWVPELTWRASKQWLSISTQSYYLSIFGQSWWFSVAGSRFSLRGDGCRLSAIGYRLSVIGCRFLVVDHQPWLTVI